MTDKKQKSKIKKSPCRCPYCDMELADSDAEYCIFCNFKIDHCDECSYPVTDKMKKCPNCGTIL